MTGGMCIVKKFMTCGMGRRGTLLIMKEPLSQSFVSGFFSRFVRFRFCRSRHERAHSGLRHPLHCLRDWRPKAVAAGTSLAKRTLAAARNDLCFFLVVFVSLCWTDALMGVWLHKFFAFFFHKLQRGEGGYRLVIALHEWSHCGWLLVRAVHDLLCDAQDKRAVNQRNELILKADQVIDGCPDSVVLRGAIFDTLISTI